MFTALSDFATFCRVERHLAEAARGGRERAPDPGITGTGAPGRRRPTPATISPATHKGAAVATISASLLVHGGPVPGPRPRSRRRARATRTGSRWPRPGASRHRLGLARRPDPCSPCPRLRRSGLEPLGSEIEALRFAVRRCDELHARSHAVVTPVKRVLRQMLGPDGGQVLGGPRSSGPKG